MENEELEITSCARFGTLAPPSINTMKVSGLIKNCHVTILIDSSSSHNFVDLRLVKRLRTQLDTKHLFNVKIADRGKVATKGTLAQAYVKIQDFHFIIDLYAIPLGGCDIVLGIQWLRTLGHILWDFDKLYMQFYKDSKTYCITSLVTVGNNFEDISALQMQKLLQQETTVGAILYHFEPELMFLYHLESQTTGPHSFNFTD